MYNYDSNGNVRSDTHSGIGFMIYDPDNLPVTAYLTNGEQLIYENDVNGNRVRNTISGISDNFYFNGADGKTEAVCLAPYSDNLTYNIPGAGGDNIGQVKVVGANPTRYYYLKDHLESIKMTVDATGTVQGYDDYYPYGMQMTGRSMTSSEDGRYKFTGKELDSDEGLYYFGARYYDKWRGGWDQVDPMPDDHPEESPYNYVMNNPITNVDFDGDSATVIHGFLTLDPVLSTAKQDRNYVSGWMDWYQWSLYALNIVGKLGFGNPGLVKTAQGTRYYYPKPTMNIGIVDLPGMPGLTPITLPKETLAKIENLVDYHKGHNFTPPTGISGNSIYENRTNLLPEGGNYHEYDLSPKAQGDPRGTERIVIDKTTNEIWYTNDHYEHFIKVR